MGILRLLAATTEAPRPPPPPPAAPRDFIAPTSPAQAARETSARLSLGETGGDQTRPLLTLARYDRIAILHGGRIIAEGTLAELRALFPPTTVEYVQKQPTLEEIFLAIVGSAPGAACLPDTEES